MAKRSARKARQQSAPKPPPPTAASARDRRPFWLGALAAAAVLIPLAVVAVVLAARDPDPAPAPSAGTATPQAEEESEVERLQRISQTRDKEQVQALTDQMRGYAKSLDPVVDGLDRTFPPGEADRRGPLADRREVARWARAADEAAADFEETVSGETGTNVARGALAAAVRGIARSVETYGLALEQPAARRALLEQARAQRDDAMKAWETASVQVDVINIAVGFGHQHPPTPGSRLLPPDDLPEGTDAVEGG